MTMTQSDVDLTSNDGRETQRSIEQIGIDHVPRDWAVCMECNRWVPVDGTICRKCGRDVTEA